MFRRLAGFAIALAGLAALVVAWPVASRASQPGVEYEVKASGATLNREVTGPVVAEVQGVPAEPVDAFVHDGVGVTPVKAQAKLEVDPVNNTGRIEVKWEDEYGKWELVQTTFAPPDHASGLRVGPGAGDTELVFDDPITTNVYLHGDTTAGGPVLPTVFNLLATWGPAAVTLNGEPFDNPFDGPTPLWIAHTMLTVGVRGEDGTVRNSTGGIFSPANPADGAVDWQDLEFHVVFHDAPGPMTSNFPPPLSFFYHLTFENVKVEVSGLD